LTLISLTLTGRQFVIGNDIEACRRALTFDDHDELHLLERININLQVQNSIVPNAYSLARIKIAGHLPKLQINLSDTKYKSLMRLVDVSIPHFDDEAGASTRPSLGKQKSGFRLPSGIFGGSDQDYHPDSDLELSDADDENEDSGADNDEDAFFEAQGESVEVCHRCTLAF
jgi:vacuolar protein sorting-associated protein 13A/C